MILEQCASRDVLLMNGSGENSIPRMEPQSSFIPWPTPRDSFSMARKCIYGDGDEEGATLSGPSRGVSLDLERSISS